MKATIVVLVAIWTSMRLAGSDDPPAVLIVLAAMFDLYAAAVALVELAPDEPPTGPKGTPS